MVAAVLSGCAGGEFTTREKGAGIGALGGAAAGGLIGAAAGHPGVGAAVGGALGLGAGALIGDQLQGQENRQKEQQKAIDQQRAELEKNRALIEELRKRNIEAKETSRGVMVNLPSVNFEFDSADLIARRPRPSQSDRQYHSTAMRPIAGSPSKAMPAGKAPPRKLITSAYRNGAPTPSPTPWRETASMAETSHPRVSAPAPR